MAERGKEGNNPLTLDNIRPRLPYNMEETGDSRSDFKSSHGYPKERYAEDSFNSGVRLRDEHQFIPQSSDFDPNYTKYIDDAQSSSHSSHNLERSWETSKKRPIPTYHEETSRHMVWNSDTISPLPMGDGTQAEFVGAGFHRCGTPNFSSRAFTQQRPFEHERAVIDNQSSKYNNEDSNEELSPEILGNTRSHKRDRAPRRPLNASQLCFIDDRSKIMDTDSCHNGKNIFSGWAVDGWTAPFPYNARKKSRSHSDSYYKTDDISRKVDQHWTSLPSDQRASNGSMGQEYKRYHGFSCEDHGYGMERKPFMKSCGDISSRGYSEPEKQGFLSNVKLRPTPGQGNWKGDTALVENSNNRPGFSPLPCNNENASSFPEQFQCQTQHTGDKNVMTPNDELIRLPPPRNITINDGTGTPREYQLMYAAISMPTDCAQQCMISLSAGTKDAMNNL